MSLPSASEPAPRSRRRRIWLVLIALVVITSVAGAAFVWWQRDGRFAAARQSWHPPSDGFSSSMRDKPVAGWRASVTDLGLPVPTDGAEPARIAASNDINGPKPFIGRVGDNAYFLARSGAAPNPQWWLVGIDVKSGQRIFPAVPLLTGTAFPRCFMNGPTDVLCISYELASATAWVVDARSGATIYNGPTDLRVLPAPLVVEQIDGYAVASAARQGAYGIGHRAETTWFVPGDGTISGVPNDLESRLATQESTDKLDWNTTIFDVSDGSVVKPEGPENAKLQTTVLYPGGFAAVVEVDDKVTGVQFFDDAGRRLRGGIEGRPTTDQTGILPIVSGVSGDDSTTFSPDGGPLLEMPSGHKYLVGGTMLLNETNSDDFPMWRQYDLRSGDKGPACDFNMRNFLGTDGSVFVFAVTNRKAEFILKARDRNTCDTLWTLPSAVDSLARVWRINTTLVQLSDDGTELTSLVAPH